MRDEVTAWLQGKSGFRVKGDNQSQIAAPYVLLAWDGARGDL